MDLVLHWSTSAGAEELGADELWNRGATAVQLGDGVLLASFPTEAATRQAASELGATVEEVDPAWQDAWKSFAEPVELPGVVVTPAWREVELGVDRLSLSIDPGPVFGSGSHPSTRLLLGLLAESPPSGLDVLDVGTGSGILAVAAALLGAARVTAIDVDPAAVPVARANAARNRVAGQVEVSTTAVSEVGGGHDLVLVNLTAGVHAEVGADAAAAVRPGGRLWLAGLLPGQWRHVAGAYPGCKVVAETALDGWVGAILAKAGGVAPTGAGSVPTAARRSPTGADGLCRPPARSRRDRRSGSA